MHAARPIFGILLIVGVAFGIVSPPAEAQGFLGASAGVYHPEEGTRDSIGTFGVRGGYRFNPHFGLEGSLGQVNLDDAVLIDLSFLGTSRLELGRLYNLDLSLQWFPNGGSFLLFGGIGGSRLNSTLRESFLGEHFTLSATSYLFTVHAGLAYQWQLGDRLVLRPEARLRHFYGEDPKTLIPGAYKATDYEAGLTFGWRLGS